MDSSKANQVLGNFDKKLGLARPPPPLLGQNPKFTQKKNWTAPLSQRLSLAICSDNRNQEELEEVNRSW